MVLGLKILCNSLVFRKYCFNDFRNVLSIITLMFREKGRAEPDYPAFPLLLLVSSLALFVFGVKTK